MGRFSLVATLAAVGMLALAGTASADVGDINRLSIDSELTGTAETVEVSGTIRCTTTIEYGLVVGVGQDVSGSTGESTGRPTFMTDANSGEPNLPTNADAEGVGAFGPNQGNEANSPCSTNIQGYEVVVQRNRDSANFQEGSIYAIVTAGTSAENGDRGPGPFIGDLMWTDNTVDFTRTDP